MFCKFDGWRIGDSNLGKGSKKSMEISMKGGGSNQKSIVRLIGAITIIRSIPDSENNLDIGCCTQYYLKRRGRPIRNLRVDGSQCSGRIHNVESDNSSR